jgi:hypothetical protein
MSGTPPDPEVPKPNPLSVRWRSLILVIRDVVVWIVPQECGHVLTVWLLRHPANGGGGEPLGLAEHPGQPGHPQLRATACLPRLPGRRRVGDVRPARGLAVEVAADHEAQHVALAPTLPTLDLVSPDLSPKGSRPTAE